MEEPAISVARPLGPQRFLKLDRKYLPVALCVLLALVWVASIYVEFGVYVPLPPGVVYAGSDFGSVELEYDRQGRFIRPFKFRPERKWNSSWSCFGSLGFGSSRGEVWLQVPLPLLLACAIPVAYGCLHHFRFPMWTWFAWTILGALVFAHSQWF